MRYAKTKNGKPKSENTSSTAWTNSDTRHSAASLHVRSSLFALSLLALAASSASAQEAMYTAAATMPGPGSYALRQQIHFWQFGSNPNDGSEDHSMVELHNALAIGLDRGIALNLAAPVSWDRKTFTDESIEDDEGWGFDDLEASLKLRVYQNDSGGINTVRAALIGGLRLNTDDQLYASPFVSGVVTVVHGRHGFNQEVGFTLNPNGLSPDDNMGGDGPSDAVHFNSAYVFRVFPDRFKSDTVGAWYATIEMNGLYETSGDTELRWSPGFMYEGRRWGFEIMAQFPLYQDVNHRAELDWAIGVGWRYLF